MKTILRELEKKIITNKRRWFNFKMPIRIVTTRCLHCQSIYQRWLEIDWFKISFVVFEATIVGWVTLKLIGMS